MGSTRVIKNAAEWLFREKHKTIRDAMLDRITGPTDIYEMDRLEIHYRCALQGELNRWALGLVGEELFSNLHPRFNAATRKEITEAVSSVDVMAFAAYSRLPESPEVKA